MSYQVDFEEFDAANPEIYRAFREQALALLQAGVKQYGPNAIMEVIRFHTAIRGEGDAFKINDKYTSRYARKLVAEDPRFENFFRLRALRTV